jgi:hypothetical protein
MVLDGTSDSGVYSLPVEITYGGTSSTTKTQVLNLVVQRQPQLRIGFYRDVGTAWWISPSICHRSGELGRDLLNVGMVEVSSYQMDVQRARCSWDRWRAAPRDRWTPWASLRRPATWTCW